MTLYKSRDLLDSTTWPASQSFPFFLPTHPPTKFWVHLSPLISWYPGNIRLDTRVVSQLYYKHGIIIIIIIPSHPSHNNTRMSHLIQ